MAQSVGACRLMANAKEQPRTAPGGGREGVAAPSSPAPTNMWARGGCREWNGSHCARMAREGSCRFAMCHEHGVVGEDFARSHPGHAQRVRSRRG